MRYFLLSILLLPLTLFAQNEAEDILIKADKSLSIRSSMHYTAESRFKFFDYDDTSTTKGTVSLLKAVSDTIFGGYVRYSTDDSVYKLYDLHGIYIVNSKSDTVKRFDAHNNEYWAMTGNISYRIVLEAFLETGKLQKKINGKNIISRLRDTSILGRDCYTISIKTPDTDDYSDIELLLCVNKTDMVPVYTRHKIKFQGNYQYHTFLINDYTFNSVSRSVFTIDKKRRKTIIDTFKRVVREEEKLLAKGDAAPAITGFNPTKDTVQQSFQLIGKVTILDFWYMSCFPCIKAMPMMEDIYEKYSREDLQVLGINSVDNNKAALKKLPQFLEYNPIKYPIVMVSPELTKAFHVQAFPSFYIIDKEGKVAYSSAGYGDKTKEELTAIIDELLK